MGRILEAYRIPVVPWRVVPTPTAAARAARGIGGSVALKAVAPTLLHKSDAGGVRLGLHDPRAAQVAAAEIRDRVQSAGHAVEGFLVQAMVPTGVEMFVGVVHDGVFGPVVACGAGGTAVELLHDVQVRIAPLADADADAEEMIRSLTTFPLLDGYRGAPKADVAGLEDVLLRVSALVDAHHEIAEMDLNPVMVGPDGAVVVDARIRIESPTRRLPLAARLRG
ncbi:MAG: acetate--CoA ligase family protein [Actinomycetota bacterium]